MEFNLAFKGLMAHLLKTSKVEGTIDWKPAKIYQFLECIGFYRNSVTSLKRRKDLYKRCS